MIRPRQRSEYKLDVSSDKAPGAPDDVRVVLMAIIIFTLPLCLSLSPCGVTKFHTTTSFPGVKIKAGRPKAE
jgi:hypothetical protein